MEYSIYTTGFNQELKGALGNGTKMEFFFVPMALNIASALFCFAAIFLFRNRSMQKKVTLVAVFMIIALSVLCGINGQQLPWGIAGASAHVCAFLPLAAILFSLLAIRGIRKDEQLLRSADRLR